MFLLLGLSQAGSSHGLTHAAELLVGQSQIDGLVDLRILVSQHALALLQQQVAALTGHDAAQQQNMLEGIQVIVVSQSVAQIAADGVIDLGGLQRVQAKSYLRT